MKVLLTGFDPFGGESLNPSWEVVRQLAQDDVEGITLITVQLPTVYGASLKKVTTSINLYKPDVVIALGQAGGRPDISIERVALNINDAPIPDNEGNQPIDTSIVDGGPAAYFSTLPIKRMVAELRSEGIPASISNSAGTFVCNHVMYGILHYIAEQRLPTRAGFIHIPYLPVQAVLHKNAPSMDRETLIRGLKVAIRAALA